MDLYDYLFLLAWFTPMPDGWGIPILWTGPAGATKTGRHSAWARKMRSIFEHCSPGQKGEAYFGCTPSLMQDRDGNYFFGFPPNQNILSMCSAGRGLILLDELRAAPTIVGPSLLGILQEREWGDLSLPTGVRVMAASNSAKESVNGRSLSAPAANRVCHINWQDPEPSQMRDHALRMAAGPAFAPKTKIDTSNYEHWQDVEDRILAARQQGMSKALVEVFSYCERVKNAQGESILRNQPALGSTASDGPWASPRTWWGVGETVFAYRELVKQNVIPAPMLPGGGVNTREADSTILRTMVEGWVGPGVGGAYLEWLSEQDIPDYAEWLDGRIIVNFSHGIRDDRTFTIMQGAAAHVVNIDDPDVKLRRARKFFEIALNVANNGGFELVSSAVALVADADPSAVYKEKTAFTSTYAKRISDAKKQMRL